MNINLIREMIRIELLYKQQKKLYESADAQDNEELPVADIKTDDLYIDEPVDINNLEKSGNKLTSDTEKDYSAIVNSRSGQIFNKLFTKGDKNLTVDMLKTALNSEKSNKIADHTNDLKKEVYEFFNFKKLSNYQCDSIYQNIYNKKDDIKYLQSIIDFKFDSYKLANLNALIENLNTNLAVINDTSTFDYDMYRNNTAPSSGGYNTGKGELFLLCYLSDAKTGSTKQHDIIGDKFEYEVKQGVSEGGAVDFNTKLRRHTAGNNAQKDFLNKLNGFLSKFIASTKHMDEILNLTSKYESAFILDEFTTAKKDVGDVARAISPDYVNSLCDLDDFYGNKMDNFYFATIFPGLSAVLSNQHNGAATFDVSESTQAASNFDLRGEMEKFLPIMDYISGRSNTGANIKKNNLYNKNFNEKSFDKLQKLFFKFSVASDKGKPKPKVEIIDTTSPTFTKLKKNDTSYQVTPVINVLKNIRDLSDKNNPIKKNGIVYNVSSTSLKTWLRTYFNMVIKQYKDALGFYEKILNDLNNEALKQPDIKFDLIQKLNSNQNKLQSNYLKYEKFGSEENLKQLLNYKVFLDFWKGLSFKDEVVIDIKHYDDNNQLKHRKQIINTIGDEFEILLPNNAQVDVNKFFNSLKDDETVDLRIKNENISDKQFEDIMKSKEIFSFLNKNLGTTKTTATEQTSVDPNLKVENPIAINKSSADSSTILGILDELIDSLLNLHDAVYNEYIEPEVDKVKKKGGLIYIAEKNNIISSFNVVFNGDNKNEYNSDIFKSIESFKNFVNEKAKLKQTVPIIKDITGSELLWMSYNPESEYILTELLRLRDTVVFDLNEIEEIVKKIKATIKSLISKNQGSKNLNKLIKR